jgi:alpha-L-fucosidase
MTASTIPAHLEGHKELSEKSPREAALQWFREAKFGLFVHYALASLIPRGKPGLLEMMAETPHLVEVMEASPEELEKMDISEEEKKACLAAKRDLMSRFTAERFDAEAICDLAEAANMRYVTLTTKHLGGLFLFRNSLTDFSAVNTAAGRDLVSELTAACARRGLGYFHYVPPEFARTDGAFLERNHTLLRELLTNYGPIAGIWFDGIGKYYQDPDNYARLSETYALIRELQPHCLISFKEGANGEEDFITPEHFLLPEPVEWDTPKRQARWEIRLERWERHNKARWRLFRDKPAEINGTMQECLGRDGVGEPSGWIDDESARHLTAGEVWFLLKVARSQAANFLLNIGPRGDGSIHPDDNESLREVGRRIREEGFPGE